jgi:hypothetical protein
MNFLKATHLDRLWSWTKTAAKITTIGFGLLGVAVAGTQIESFVRTKSMGFRTDQNNAVHKRLGEVYAHLGDNVPLTRVATGSVLYIHNKYIKTQTCYGFTSNVFWDMETHVVYHYSMFTNWFAEGAYEANEMFVIPDYMPAGHYHIIKKTVSICNGQENYTTNYDIVVDFYKPKK